MQPESVRSSQNAVRGPVSGQVMAEVTAVSPEGRITCVVLGIGFDGNREASRRITAFVEAQSAVPTSRIAHAVRADCGAGNSSGGCPLAVAIPEGEAINVTCFVTSNTFYIRRNTFFVSANFRASRFDEKSSESFTGSRIR